MKRFVVGIIAAAVLVSMAGTAMAQLKIAVAGPLTGPNAAFGAQLKVGAEQAAADIGAILGQKIELDGPSFLREKKVQGCSMGSNRFKIDMPRYVELYRQGRLKLDEMITRRGRLEDVNEAFRAMKAGEVARTVLMFD